eukprot:GILI01027504.1.p1 GENE.GILI01027504.1~~GILI01027504.1.p1  ORF type:complete len:188 (-),score=15.44 GILI01027504.1:294-830(-)
MDADNLEEDRSENLFVQSIEKNSLLPIEFKLAFVVKKGGAFLDLNYIFDILLLHLPSNRLFLFPLPLAQNLFGADTVMSFEEEHFEPYEGSFRARMPFVLFEQRIARSLSWVYEQQKKGSLLGYFTDCIYPSFYFLQYLHKMSAHNQDKRAKIDALILDIISTLNLRPHNLPPPPPNL